jgi:hypothetical protein
MAGVVVKMLKANRLIDTIVQFTQFAGWDCPIQTVLSHHISQYVSRFMPILV